MTKKKLKVKLTESHPDIQTNESTTFLNFCLINEFKFCKFVSENFQLYNQFLFCRHLAITEISL